MVLRFIAALGLVASVSWMANAQAQDAQPVAFLSKADTEAVVVGKGMRFNRPSDGKELHWDFKEGGYLFADNRGTGKRDSGNWKVRDDGALCTSFRGNSEESCYFFFKDQGMLKRSVGKSAHDVSRSVVMTPD